MRTTSSPLPLWSGVGSTNVGWPAASGPVPASGSSPPRQVRGPAAPGSCGVLDVAGPSPSVTAVTRQKPALWSATQTRPAGSTIAPVEMCSPAA